MDSKYSKFVWRILWLVGLFVFLYISSQIEMRARNISATTFTILPVIWIRSIAPFVFGIYLALLFVKGWSIKWNPAIILCITVPSLIMTFYFPVLFTIIQYTTINPNSFSVAIPFWMNSSFDVIVPIVAGLTLMVGLLDKKELVNK
ncbi:hypothetical protein MHB48_16500 [Psychrobacillus sp. FSL H8-0483]|uniref:hypothetical protein n=1 Tax=Psychrobacillus sp. FSL H8-0483 TaxID=2921389 RepID=UPI00315AAE96